jgi:hypothetical protein
MTENRMRVTEKISFRFIGIWSLDRKGKRVGETKKAREEGGAFAEVSLAEFKTQSDASFSICARVVDGIAFTSSRETVLLPRVAQDRGRNIMSENTWQKNRVSLKTDSMVGTRPHMPSQMPSLAPGVYFFCNTWTRTILRRAYFFL